MQKNNAKLDHSVNFDIGSRYRRSQKVLKPFFNASTLKQNHFHVKNVYRASLQGHQRSIESKVLLLKKNQHFAVLKLKRQIELGTSTVHCRRGT